MTKGANMMNIIIEKVIEDLLKDYFWMRNEVKRLSKLLYGVNIPMKSWGIAQYGIEAAMPKGSSGKSQAELRDLDIREERLYKRLVSYQEKVYAIEIAADFIKDEKSRIVYDCLLEGMSYQEIANHLGISKDKVRDMKKGIIRQLGQKGQEGQFLQLLNIENIA
jgi:DNA-binding CsgD family transcriptional regulator